MKTLLVLRHAKSDRSNPNLADHERPLAPRGETDAPRMGTALAALDMIPDFIITSTAVRARETARLVAGEMGNAATTVETRDVYAASGDALLNLLPDQAGDHDTVLIAGHNPGMEELIGLLTGGAGAGIGVRMPTAALACLTLDIAQWRDVTPGSGTLQWLLTPRIVAPLLGATKRR
jgi:phosphohistidine phosphatase